MNFSFMTVANEQYFETLLISVKQVKKFYPNSTFYIYDWGLTDRSKKALELVGNIKLIEWKLLFVDIHTERSIRFQFLKSLTILRDAVINILRNQTTNKSLDNILDAQKFEMKLYNNFLCIENFQKNVPGQFIFIDADAFLIDSVDELLDGSFGIGLTVRRKHEFSYAHNDCAVLNGGVLFFFGNDDKNASFIKAWHMEIDETRETICNQTSIVRMLRKKQKDIFENTNTINQVTLAGNRVNIKILPCDVYNFSWIEEFNTQQHIGKVKVLHFKSGRFKTGIFKKIVKELAL